jgi:large subunit ribosomal protein L9
VKVLLREDVESLGKKGDLLDVADGYARNYLVPKGLAIQASKGAVKQADAMRRNREARDARDREAADAVRARLDGQRFRIPARAGEGGRLFGSVTNVDIAAAVAAQVGVDVDRRDITLADPLKELGEVEVPVKLHEDIVANLTIEVVAE